ncbi:phosphatidyl serine synthase family protein [Cryptosporidium serpentis]
MPETSVQTLKGDSIYVSPQVGASLPPVTMNIQSHSLLVLCITLISLWMFSELVDNGYMFSISTISTRQRIILGIYGSVIFFLVFAILQLPDSIMRRPHPIFWRFLLGLSILYLSFLIFLLFQDIESILSALRNIDFSLDKSTVEVNYTEESCSLLDWSNGILYNVRQRLDFFAFAHFFGWFIKALILRDNFLLWFNSIFFEWLELTFKHLLPNFHECWWDHLILDIFGCNFLGIIAGNIFIRKIKLYQYNWHNSYSLGSFNKLDDTSMKSDVSITKATSKTAKDLFDFTDNINFFFLNLRSKYKKVENSSDNSIFNNKKPKRDIVYMAINLWSKFGIYTWTEYKWPKTLSNMKGFMTFLLLTVIVQLVDLNYFFIKAELLLPVSHWILALRTICVAICGAAATRELYEFVTNTSNNSGKVGIQCWVLIAIVFTESFLCWRFRHTLKAQNLLPPNYIMISWVGIFIVVTTTFIYFIVHGITGYILTNSYKTRNMCNKIF